MSAAGIGEGSPCCAIMCPRPQFQLEAEDVLFVLGDKAAFMRAGGRRESDGQPPPMPPVGTVPPPMPTMGGVELGQPGGIAEAGANL